MGWTSKKHKTPKLCFRPKSLFYPLVKHFYPTTSDLVTEIAMEGAGSLITQNPTPGGGPSSQALHPEAAPHPICATPTTITTQLKQTKL